MFEQITSICREGYREKGLIKKGGSLKMINSFINQIHYDENRTLRMLNMMISQKRKIGVFGAGGYAKTLIDELRGLSIFVDFCVVDDSYYIEGTTCNNVPIISVEECNIRYKKSILVIGFGMTYQREQDIIIRIRGIIDQSIDILDFEDQFLSYFYYMDYSFVLKNCESFQWLFDRLFDDESKRLLVDYVNGRISGDLHALRSYVSQVPFDYRLDLLFNRIQEKEGVIVDCGAYDGSTAIQIDCYLQGKSRIYAFEFDDDNFSKLKHNTVQYKNIVPIKKGIWNCTCILEKQGNGQDAFIKEERNPNLVMDDERGTQDGKMIEVMALDDFIAVPVSAILMDIEGAEAYALRGAEKIIRRYHPAIAVRLYHRPLDFITIPGLIDRMTDIPYMFFLRYDCHYRGAADLTLYAI